MANELVASYAVNGLEVKLDATTVRNYLTNGSGKPNDSEVAMFINLCKYQGLNPFLREAYLIKYSDNAPATTVVGKDAFTRRARKIEECNGYTAGVAVMKKNGDYAEREGAIVLDGEKLVGGWCEVYCKGWDKPFKSTAALAEYDQHNTMWKSKPATMIRKVALVQALREAFPSEFQGMYDSAEMPVDSTKLPDNDVKVDVKVEEPQKPTPKQKKAKAEEPTVIDITPEEEQKIGTLELRRFANLLQGKHIEIAKIVCAKYGYKTSKDILMKDFIPILNEIQNEIAHIEAMEKEPESELDTIEIKIEGLGE